MMNKESNKGFSCPSEIPDSVEDNLFCTPLKCPPKVPVKRFSSPTTKLSPEEFEKQMQCIEEINNLLRTITNPRDPNNLSGLRLHFRNLRGAFLEVELDCDDRKESIKGILKDTGRDFLEIEDIGKNHLIPYVRICMISSNDCETPMGHGHRDMEEMDECLRRDIVLNFGKVVSKDPNLINLFFGIPLYLKLTQFIDCKVMVRAQGKEDNIEGKLKKTLMDKIGINTSDNTVVEINITDICSIAI